MKKLILSAIAGALLSSTAFGAVTISLSVGFLYGNNTSSIFPDSGLIQLVSAGVDGAFSDPLAGSFATGDDRVFASFKLDSVNTTSTPGVTVLAFSGLDYSSLGVAAGQKVELRWFSTLQLADLAAGPTAGSVFGRYTNSTAIDGSDPWVLPADGNTTFNFLTTGMGGSNPESAGVASLVVAPIPEPSTYALCFGLFSLGLAGFRRFRRA